MEKVQLTLSIFANSSTERADSSDAPLFSLLNFK